MIKWGIIGCGDVTEIKSGPAFNKVNNSQLLAVMRRDGDKAKDYAQRHQVPHFYTDAGELINHPEINAVYIATPPDTHELYALAAIAAGKNVYLEKPMALNYSSACKIKMAAENNNVKLVIAHYRRAQPMFVKIKALLNEQAIGKVSHINLDYRRKAFSDQEMLNPTVAWRLDPTVSGGGIFHDLAPHQLGLMVYFFGEPFAFNGVSGNVAGLYTADDMVSGNILFENAVQFNGSWCFAANAFQEKDTCEIFGSLGSIRFSFFNEPGIKLTINNKEQEFNFDPLQHVQQPLIEKMVSYFSEVGPNPCPAEEGCAVLKIMDAFTGQN